MGRKRGVAKPEQSGEAKQNVLVGVDRQPADAALPVHVLAVKPRQIFQSAAGPNFRKGVNVGETANKFSPVSVFPPLRLFAQQMDAAWELVTQRIGCDERVRQPVWPRNNNPQFGLPRHGRSEERRVGKEGGWW